MKRPAHIGIALVLVGLLALFGWLGRRGDAPGAVSSDRASPGVSSDSLLGEVEPNSIAVLPFRNLSPDPENAFFADGMTEELTSRLSRLGDLTVVASSSVMRYHDSSLTPAAVGEELRVASVLDGSVRRAGDDVRITGQLIDVASQQNLWSNTYQRRLEDIFRVQSEVAEEIVAALELELEPDEAAVLTRQPTGNLSAYDLFLRGVHYADRGRKDDNELAIGFFDRAIAEAPDFALAFAARSRAYERRASLYGFPRRWLDAALEDAERAVDLDPTLPDAQTALARALFSKGLLEASLEANLRAVELEPNNQSAARSLGWLYSEMGQPDEALRWYKRAVRLDPANAFRYALVGLGYVDLAMHHAAETWLARSLELAPDSLGNRNVLAVNYLNQERFADAAAVGEEILAISPGEPMGLTIVGIARHMAGDLEAAEAYYRRNLDGVWAWYRVRMLLARILWDSGRRDEALEVMAPAVESLEADLASGSSLWWTFYSLAQAEAIRGDDERAYELLEQAVDAGATSYVVYRNDPCFGEILEEERHQRAEAFMAATGADIRHGGGRAFYSLLTDRIQLPPFETFRDGGSYYGTACHELTHWTGHASRCDRQFGRRFGDDAYAAEELVAELGAAFLCAELGIDGQLQHPEYIGNWLRVLRGDKRAIFTASSKARQAAEFLKRAAGWEEAEDQGAEEEAAERPEGVAA